MARWLSASVRWPPDFPRQYDRLTSDTRSAAAASPEADGAAPPTLPRLGGLLRARALGLSGGGWLTLVAVAVVVTELGLAAARTSVYAQIGYRNAKAPPLLVRDADVDAFAYFDPTLAMVAAQRVIPRDATYTIVVGNEEAGRNMTPAFATIVYRFWLVPRRYTQNIHRARWALTYFKSSESLGVPYVREIGLGPGVNAVLLKKRP